jgi:cytochrome c-type biogenesis protein CcmF
MPLTDAAIHARPMRHLYVSMGEQLGQQSWIMHIQYKPLVGWIWGGCILMALGGAMAAMDRRYRVSKPARQSVAAAEGTAA